MKTLTAAALLLTAAGTAQAAPPATQAGAPPIQWYVDGYYVPTFNVRSDPIPASPTDPFNEGGSGIGARGFARVGEFLGFAGEYQKSKVEFETPAGSDSFDVITSRFGAGLVGPSTSGVFVDWIDRNFKDDTSSDHFKGPSLRVRVAHQATQAIQVYGEGGYLRLKEDDEKIKGSEFSAGVAMRLSGRFGVFADYRRSHLEPDDNPTDETLKTNEWRVGFRFNV